MLFLDALGGHLSEELKDKLEAKNCDLIVIPGGPTIQHLPLNVPVNYPFKDC
jgi:hypothetical protein